MATQAATRNISGLARAMVQQGLLSEFDADALHTHPIESPTRARTLTTTV